MMGLLMSENQLETCWGKYTNLRKLSLNTQPNALRASKHLTNQPAHRIR